MNYKNIKRAFSFCFAIALISSFSACTDDDIWTVNDEEVKFSEFGVNFETKGGLVGVRDIVNGFYDFAKMGDATIGFTIAPAGDPVTSVDIMKSYNGASPILHQTITSFPANVSISLSEAINGITTIDNVELGDVITYSLSNLQTSSGQYPVGASVEAEVKCNSALLGTFDAVTTGAGVWGGSEPCTNVWEGQIVIEQGVNGLLVYSVDDTHAAGEEADYSFGAYYACYGATATLPGGDLALVDFCDNLSFTGLSQWDETYTIENVSSDGDKLTFEWSNNYGEAGSTILTRDDGNDWPTYSF